MISALLEQAGIDIDQENAPHDDPSDVTEQTQNDLWAYFKIFEKFPDADFDPEDKQQLFEEIDEFRGNITPEREDRMDAEIGINKKEVKLYAELRKDRADITDSGFFDLSEEAWTTLRDQATVDLPETRQEFIDGLQEQVAEEFKGQFGDLPPEALSVLYQNHPALKAHAALLEGSRQQFLRSNPAITELILKWGYLPSSKGNLNVVGSQFGTQPIAIGGSAPAPVTDRFQQSGRGNFNQGGNFDQSGRGAFDQSGQGNFDQ